MNKTDLSVLYFAIVSHDIMRNPNTDDFDFVIAMILNAIFVSYLMSRSLSGWLFLCGFLTILCFGLRFLLTV